MKILKDSKRFIYSWIDKTFLADCCPNIHGLEARRSMRSKAQHRKIFKKYHLPHAEGVIFINPLKAFQFVRKQEFPVVVKPNVGGFSRGSYFPITNYRELLRGIIGAKRYWLTSVIEKYLLGHNYRVTVFRDKIIAVAERFPPFVVGNGHSTIEELIDEENAIKKKMNLFPVMYPIPKNKTTKGYLKKQGLTLRSIPKKKERVLTFYRLALKPGGVVHNLDINQCLSPKNKKTFIKILEYFNAQILGIDVIMEKSITIDYDKQKCIFLEVNPRPYLPLHQFPRWGKVPHLKPLLEKINKIKVEGSDRF